jgi:hypothetical protein
MGGLLGQVFGVCANEFGADGRVVALGYGCGAHSTVREIEGTGVPVTDIVIDENVLDTLDLTVAEVPAVVAELMADDSDVVVIDASELDDLEVVVLDEPVVGLEPDDEDDDGYLVDDDEDDDDSDDEDDDEADDDGYLSDDDDEDGDVVDVVESPDQIALELDDVDDIEPDETL